MWQVRQDGSLTGALFKRQCTEGRQKTGHRTVEPLPASGIGTQPCVTRLAGHIRAPRTSGVWLRWLGNRRAAIVRWLIRAPRTSGVCWTRLVIQTCRLGGLFALCAFGVWPEWHRRKMVGR